MLKNWPGARLRKTQRAHVGASTPFPSTSRPSLAPLASTSALVLLIAAGCTGKIGTGGSGVPGDSSTGVGGGASALGGRGGVSTGSAAGTGTNPADPGDPNAAGPMPLRRLNRSEYNNTVRDLLGDTTQPANAFPL